LTKTGRRRTRASAGRDEAPRNDESRGEGDLDEAAVFIAETLVDLARLARRHKLDLLVRLLEMAPIYRG
jgi:hypothetical protein